MLVIDSELEEKLVGAEKYEDVKRKVASMERKTLGKIYVYLKK